MSANWYKPLVSSTYANFVAEVKARDDDLALAFDPAHTTPTGTLPTNTVGWNSSSNRWKKWNGTQWVDLATTYNISISGTAVGLTGTLPVTNGGTGLTGYTVGDIIYASGATTLAKRAAVAAGYALISAGVGVAPAWGQIGLTTHVTGTLPVTNGGTGVATLTGVAFGNGTGAFTAATGAQLAAAIGSTAVTYLSATQQINTITGKQASMSMSQDSGAAVGSFLCRATGTGDSNLAGMTFFNDVYAIKLGIRADGYFGLGGWSRGAWSWYSDPNGNMVAVGNVTAYSDPRLKENFRRVVDPFAILNEIDGGTFNWRHGFAHTECKAGKRDYGILADQVEAVMPEIITESIEIDGESYKTVAYEKLVPVLIEAVKQLHEELLYVQAQLAAIQDQKD